MIAMSECEHKNIIRENLIDPKLICTLYFDDCKSCRCRDCKKIIVDCLGNDLTN